RSKSLTFACQYSSSHHVRRLQRVILGKKRFLILAREIILASHCFWPAHPLRRWCCVPSWRILFAVREYEIEPATLFRLINQLHRRKLVRREKPPSDNRSLKISLTPAGIKLFDRSLPFAHEVETAL